MIVYTLEVTRKLEPWRYSKLRFGCSSKVERDWLKNALLRRSDVVSVKVLKETEV